MGWALSREEEGNQTLWVWGHLMAPHVLGGGAHSEDGKGCQEESASNLIKDFVKL